MKTTFSTKRFDLIMSRRTIHMHHHLIQAGKHMGEIMFDDDKTSSARYHAAHWTSKTQAQQMYTNDWQAAKRFALTGQR
jgi:hypothetical protein